MRVRVRRVGLVVPSGRFFVDDKSRTTPVLPDVLEGFGFHGVRGAKKLLGTEKV